MESSVIEGELSFDLECNQECETIVEEKPRAINERKGQALLKIEIRREQRELENDLDGWG